ncbi:MAG: CRTAC1 family protein [Myxococcota bacterium]|nr:CRTAC1 family protein [Myxococcota bacterium]
MKHFLFPALMFGCASENTNPPLTETAIQKPSVEETERAWANEYLQSMTELIGNEPVYRDLNTIEAQVLRIEKSFFLPFERLFNGDSVPSADTLEAFLSEAVGQQRLSWTALPLNEGSLENLNEGIYRGEMHIDTEGDHSFAAFLQSVKTVDAFQWDIFDALFTPKSNLKELTLFVRVDFRAQLKNSDFLRLNDKATLQMTFASDGNSWALTNIETTEAERLLSTRAPTFVNATDKWKLDALPVTDRKEAIRRGGYALVVADLDGDSLKDMIVGHHGPVQILKNTGESFIDVTAEYGILEEGSVKSAAVDDLDNDGDKDIVFLRFVEQGQDQLGDFVAYENVGTNGAAKFERHLNLLPRERKYDRAMPLTLADFNGDGNTDIYIGFPGLRDFTSGIYNRERPNDLHSQGIWSNKGDWTFEELDLEFGVVNDNGVYAHAALASDLNGDGRPELIVVDDSGRINPIYQRDESGRYTETAESMGLKMSGMSMGMTTGDFNNDGHMDIMASHVTLTAGERLFNMAQHVNFTDPRYGDNFAALQESYTGILLYENQGDGHFVDVTERAQLSWTGEAASAGEWIDFNHDGLLDYYLPNGLWTNGEEQLDSIFFRSELAAYADPLHTGILDEEVFQSTEPEGLEDLQTLKLDFQNDVHGGSNFAPAVREEEQANPILRMLRRHKDESDAYTFSLGGDQRNRLYRNNGDGTFTEVGYLEGADCSEDGYIVAPIDIDNNGTQDLVLRNTDPAIGNHYDPVILLENTAAAESIEVRFAGTRSPLGAKVVAVFSSSKGTETVTREVRSVNGAVQAEPTAFFGVPNGSSLVSLSVTWPNGSREDLDMPEAGTLIVRADR